MRKVCIRGLNTVNEVFTDDVLAVVVINIVVIDSVLDVVVLIHRCYSHCFHRCFFIVIMSL